MAALLKFGPPRGVPSAAGSVARLNRIVDATLRRQARARPLLMQQWTVDADGCLSCYWEIGIPPEIPIPPD
jgi:hypothetical protein